VISSVTKPAHEIESEWRGAYLVEEKFYQAALELYNLDVKVWETQYREAAKKNKVRPPKPESTLGRPVLRRLTTSDATFESLHQVLSENPAGLFVLRDELTGWLAGLERQGREQERAFYLECWSGNAPFTIDRIGRGSVHVPNCCISLFGGIQPARLRAYLADALQDGPSNDGLIQRFQLLVWPDIAANSVYVDREPDEIALEQATLVYRRLAGMSPESPLRLQFDDEAQGLFEQWLTRLDHRVRSEDLAPVMQAHLAKYRGLMPSLALLFALADGHTESVPLGHARMAREWCTYLETHASRVYASQTRPEHQAAITLSRRLEQGWKREDGFFTLRDVYRSGWTGLDQPEAARAALRVLEEYGWVRRVAIGDALTPGRPSETYIRNPRIEAKQDGKQAMAGLVAA
jgi:putative DNA primase/helicase